MIIPNTIDIIGILTANGNFWAYVILFFLKCIEGPIVITLAAFATSLGYLNIGIVFILGVLSGVLPDMILYALGRSLRIKSVERIVAYFGLHQDRINWLMRHIKENPIKVLVIVKHIPPLPVPGIILLGFMKMNFKKFMLIQIVLNTLGVLFFASLGFYGGMLAINVLRYLRMGDLILFVLVVIVALAYFFSKYFIRHLSKLYKTI